MDLIFSFDSEDYLTPAAADAELWWAQELSARGWRGCWQLVGELVRTLRRRGRTDVIAAIGEHEIDFHTNYHSRPPTHPPALEGKSLAAGVEWVLRAEAPGLETLAATFGRWPVSYCSPGDSWTPATLLAMARAGLKVFCDDKLRGFSRAPYWYCGLLLSSYTMDFQAFYEPAHFQEGAFENFVDDFADRAGPDEVLVLYTHPCRLVTTRFWDRVFLNGADLPLEQAPPAPLRPAAEIRLIQDRCRRFLDWLARRRDLRVIDYATLWAERGRGRVDLEELLARCGLAPGREGELPLRPAPADAFMPSSVFDDYTYSWVPYPEGFRGKRLIEQAANLAWTAAPARRQVKRGKTFC